MRSRAFAFALAVGVLLVGGAPAGAITYGQPDGGLHPEVGAILAEAFTPGVQEQFCSGVLLSPTVVVTAGHCMRFLESKQIPSDRVWVSFDQDVDPVTPDTNLVRGSWTIHPQFGRRQDDPADLAVIRLVEVQDTEPADLPVAGLFDRMGPIGLRGQRFTAVGYGDHEPAIGEGGPLVTPRLGERWRSVSEFEALSAAWLRLAQTEATDDGGTCHGDSGGPNFLGAGAEETDIVAGVTSTGDAMCLATNVIYRLDTPTARSFLGQYVTLP